MVTDFARKMVSLMNEQGISQRELADIVGVTEASMSRYVNTSRMPRSEVISNIATALHTTSDYLLGKEDAYAEEDEYPKIKKLIARNASQLTVEQKQELIKALLAGSKENQ